ncbi:hypothetical protein [Chryseobacterium viscerum]|uniref:Uncharacterized protein n=1 Tax=Chryseobacterium viscerum TaxID=1037377 RepID=A0A5N4BS34_9FLAO|nr:hypothetical protein [Chryseobacterium viscerum]KAB1231190.1 hypothetical protein F8D52_08975 [Chryseobacterium viscerum]
MRNIFFFLLLGPLLLSQNFKIKDSLKVLAKSNFKSMEVFENKKGELIPTRNYSYDQSKNEITIKNTSDKNKEWIKTIIKLDKNYNTLEEQRVIEGMMISEKENILIKKQVSIITKYYLNNNTLQIERFDSKEKLSVKEFNLLDEKDRVIESIQMLNISNNIVVAQIEKYNWINDHSYKYEKLTFNAPKSILIGTYQLNQYGEVQSFKGRMTINGNTELYDYNLEVKLKQFDSKGNLVKVYTLNNGKENIVEERKIIY